MIPVQLENHAKRRDRNKHDFPLPFTDNRAIAYELQRGLMTPATEADADLDTQTQERFNALTTEQKETLNRALCKRNGMVVDINDAITACLGANTAMYLLGGAEQAKAALFYLLKYMTKDNAALSSCLSVIRDSCQYVRDHPSIAEDTGTIVRGGKHFLQRILNSLNGLAEISDTQAAASLLGMASSNCSEDFAYCFIKPAVQNIFSSTITPTVIDSAIDLSIEHPDQEPAAETEQDMDDDMPNVLPQGETLQEPATENVKTRVNVEDAAEQEEL